MFIPRTIYVFRTACRASHALWKFYCPESKRDRVRGGGKRGERMRRGGGERGNYLKQKKLFCSNQILIFVRGIGELIGSKADVPRE